MRSTPSSVSFCTTHSGRSPLVGAKATVTVGSTRGWRTTGPSGTRRADGSICRHRRPSVPGATRHGHHEPEPSPATTGLPRSEAQDVEEVVGITLREDGRRRVRHEDHGRRRHQGGIGSRGGSTDRSAPGATVSGPMVS